MTDYWVSTEKHYCEICKSWMSANINNIRNHEKSDKHILCKKKMLKEMKEKEKEKREKEIFTNRELQRIEKAAKLSREQDAHLFEQTAEHISGTSLSSGVEVKSQKVLERPAPLAGTSRDAQTNIANQWYYYVDPASGRPYWYNSVTMQSVWAFEGLYNATATVPKVKILSSTAATTTATNTAAATATTNTAATATTTNTAATTATTNTAATTATTNTAATTATTNTAATTATTNTAAAITTGVSNDPVSVVESSSVGVNKSMGQTTEVGPAQSAAVTVESKSELATSTAHSLVQQNMNKTEAASMIGQWVDVPQEHSVFGDSKSHRSRMHAPIEQTALEDRELTNEEESIILLRIQNESQGVVSREDLKFVDKMTFKKKSDSQFKTEGFIKRPVNRNAFINKRGRLPDTN